jgi:crotonobetainyl-CoA:carnitine CoA-transferase CaiB-like acyl-CoA transferase
MHGALDGIRVLDLTRLAPGPYCSMLLGDMGADVIVVESVGASEERTPGEERSHAYFALGRNKRSICVDLKAERGRSVFRALVATADVVLEGFRPGVVDRLGIGHSALQKEHPRLVYCSLSGYGQTGPYAELSGHDLNYISIGGALGMIGRPRERPSIPMNFLADYAGGGMLAAFGIVTALFRRERSGRGQYVDVSMSDGTLSLATKLAGQWFEHGAVPAPGQHRINGGAPYYDVYACKDGRWVSVGALEPKFFQNLCRVLGLAELAQRQEDQQSWPELSARLSARFLERPRDEWWAELRNADACVTPVYALDEALRDPHHLARGMVASVEHPRLGAIPTVGVVPKLSETPGSLRRAPPSPGEHTKELLAELGHSDDEVSELCRSRVVSG